VKQGEICLLVGSSGSGKSLTLSLLSGLFRKGRGVEVEGRVEVLGLDAMSEASGAGLPGTGIVFQDFALLDDVRSRQNVQFGWDHRQGARKAKSEASASPVDALLGEFRLPPDLYPAQMSGGMKQRLALARAMAFQPKLLFYDEPTSGLDPAMSREVAERIRQAHIDHHMTSVIVTHDLVSLVGIADRIVLLDPVAKTLRDVAPNEVDQALEALRTYRPPESDSSQSPRQSLSGRTQAFLEATGDFVVGGFKTAAALWPRYPSLSWGRHFLWHYFRLTALGSAIPFMAIAGFIAGFITTFFVFSLMPLQGFTEPVLVEEFVGALGYVLYRVVIPGITTLLYASRSGAAIAADVGNRVLTRQADAMRSHGVPPDRYLLTGLAWTSLLGIPILFFVAYFMARVAAVSVFLATHSGHGPFAFDDRFYALVGVGGFVPFPVGTNHVLGKLLLSALGTAGIAYYLGMRPKPSGASVASGVTDTIIRATLFVLCVHLAFALFEF
jgi:ABC-type transporter Mla maintaining outer membrane lipid asymmetry ATPase subunit MlaF/ABC-type transporter Mla maintaining outer membrane lipid asymmetry permease subunit MlaE